MPEATETAVAKPVRAPRNPKPFVPHEEFIDLKRYLGSVDHQDLMLALQTTDKPRFAVLRDKLRGARKLNWDLAEIFKDCGITLKDISDAYRAFKLIQGQVKMAQHLPDVMETTAKDAISKPDVCPRCDGEKEVDITDAEGNIINRKVCPKCKGTGEITIPGLESARKLVFEASGMTGRNAPLVAQQFNVNVTESMEDSVAFTQGILEGE